MLFIPARPNMDRQRRGGRRATLALLAAVSASFVLSPAVTAGAETAGLANPPENIPRTAAIEQACAGGSGSSCQEAVVESIDEARAAEGVAPLDLPANYGSLTVPEQLLVLANRERVDRGLPGFSGLSSTLDTLALQGASTNNDPNGPANTSWGSNWAGGEATALLADYDWMYDDGYGSPNMDCTTPHGNGCWDHRANILGDYGTDPSMGAAATKVDGVTSMSELFSSGTPGHLDYTLPKAAQSLVTPTAVQIGTAPSIANSAMLTVSDAGKAFQALAQVEGDKGSWSVTPSCRASAWGKCHLFVTFLPAQQGEATAMVTVNLSGRIEQVDVNAYAGHGYWEATGNGDVLAYGGDGYRGSAARVRLAKPVVGMAPMPDGGGYWEVAADGGVFSYGDARFYGSAALGRVSTPFVGMAAASDGQGYWLANANGSIYSFGRAHYYGSLGGHAGDRVVGIAATLDGAGYWVVASNGEVYPFGDAKDFAPDQPLDLSSPVVGMARTRDGGGYWVVTKAGQVYGFGDARAYVEADNFPSAEIVGIAAATTGYYLVTSAGQVYCFGGATVAGASPVLHDSKVVAIAAV